MPTHRSAGGNRGFALAALVQLAVIAAIVAWFVYDSRGLLLALGVGSFLGIAAVAALGWWAFTTSRPWKRRLDIALAVLVVAVILLFGIVASLVYAAALVAVALLCAGYVAAAGRAAGSAPAAYLTVPPRRPVHPWLLVNPRSGNGAAARIGLVSLAHARGIDVHILADGEDLATLAAAAVVHGADALGVSGGDGSLGPVAGAAMLLNVPFFCVPTGTRNHFARDIGLDRDAPLRALDALDGLERRIDAGVASGRVFLNNVSLGAYATMVHEPKYRRDKLGTARSVLTPAFRGEAAPVPLSFLDGRGGPHDGAFVLLVANNEYETRSLQTFGARTRLDGGTLQVSVLKATSGARLAGLLMPRRAPEPDWTQWTTTTFAVGTTAPGVPAAIDGEAVMIPAPVEFALLPSALRVLVPASARPPAAPALAAFRWATIRSLGRIAVRR
jgi:diacylglycerol kinase family enzyme